VSTALPAGLIETVLGCLLHDIGKPVQRAQLGYRGKHSAIGRAFLKKVWLADARNPTEFDDVVDEPDIDARDRAILDAVSYHHGAALSAAAEHGRLAPDAVAYITYIADNIAAGTDRRKAASDSDAEGTSQWERDTPLYSVFNRFGEGTQALRFRPELLDDREPINVAVDKDFDFDKYRYTEITEKLREQLSGLERSESYVTSLLNVLEATLSFVPSSTDAAEVVDISLFDHLKLTAAFGSCIWHVLQEERVSDYRSALLDGQEKFYATDSFLLTTFDLSGIQDFIYTIHSDGAAKMLRARSFYLEILTEHLVDELLSRVGLTRANLNYSGGGHAYLLLPNTDAARNALARFEDEANDWLLSTFGPRLFLATGSAPLSAQDLMRRKGESRDAAAGRAARYADLYRNMSEQVSARKLARYDAGQIRRLNAAHGAPESGRRECKVCHSVTADINNQDLCGLCDALTWASPKIQDEPFLVIRDGGSGLPLPFGHVLALKDAAGAAAALQDGSAIRVYAKNKFHTGEAQGTRLWIGDYFKEREFSRYATNAGGIDRLGVLRLDVDNLGQAFTQGFGKQGGGAYNTISRTAAFSRMLSMFFRQHINHLLEHPKQRPITGGRERPRNITIIYSGGDDLFVVGSWDDVVEFAVELRDRFAEYTQGKLTVSAGIGMFPDKYPISAMAAETGALEAAAKSWRAEKDAVALFDTDLTFGWEELRDDVIGVKYAHVADYFKDNPERGKAFIYRMLTLIDEREDRISHARWVYLLTRMRDLTDDSARFQGFANQLHQWFQSTSDAKQLRLALYLYVYATREKENG
jgi:CRISPR-associated protein Csm1